MKCKNIHIYFLSRNKHFKYLLSFFHYTNDWIIEIEKRYKKYKEKL